MGDGADPDGSISTSMIRRAHQSVQALLDEKESNIRQDGGHRIRTVE